jgi:hypothetical protein
MCPQPTFSWVSSGLLEDGGDAADRHLTVMAVARRRAALNQDLERQVTLIRLR